MTLSCTMAMLTLSACLATPPPECHDPGMRTRVAESLLAAAFGADAVARARLSAPESDSPWSQVSEEYGKFLFYSETGSAVGFRSKAIEERSAALRSPQYEIQLLSDAQVEADQISRVLGNWEFESGELTADVRDEQRGCMVQLGAAVYRYRLRNDVLYLQGGNELVVRLDRTDKSVLALSMSTLFVATRSEYRIGFAEAELRAREIVSGWKEAGQRQVSSIERGYSHDERLLQTTEGTLRSIVESYPAYRLRLSDRHGSFLILAAEDGRILVDGRMGRD